MKNITLDWAAPIFPGKSMMGLFIGLSRDEVWDVLKSHEIENLQIDGKPVIEFANSPKLVLDENSEDIILRDTISRLPGRAVLDELFVIGFEKGKLVHLMSSMIFGASLEYYKGKIFNKFGFGMLVSDFANHCEIEFDSGDELFYSSDQRCNGISIGGACSSLEDDPDQTISYIRVYMP